PQPTPARLTGLTIGALHGGSPPLAAGGRQHGVQRPLAAVGHGNAKNVGGRSSLTHAFGNGLSHAGGRQALLEGIGRHDDAHAGFRGSHQSVPPCESCAAAPPTRTLRGSPATKASTLPMS